MTQQGTARPQPFRLAIVGGGIGGLCTLLGLLQHTSRDQITPHLYEAAPKFSEIGAGVAFGPNAVRAMRAVDPELWEAYHQVAAKAPVVTVHGEKKVAWHHFLMGMDQREGGKLKALEEIPGATPYNDNTTHNVHRATLLEEILKLLRRKGMGERVSFNKRCTDIVQDGSVLRLRFEDGTEAEVDAVVGCDGVKSRVRQIVLGEMKVAKEGIEPRFTGKYAYRGLIPMDETVTALGEWAKLNVMICGQGGHVVGFPIDKGKTFNVVAFTSPKNEARTWEHGDTWVVPTSIEDAVGDFEGWGEGVRKLLGMLRKPDKWGLFDHPPAPSYVGLAGRVALLGDCAHASTPHQGAGAAMAIEDAAVFTNLLGGVTEWKEDTLKRVFQVYDALRRPRTQELVTTSRQCGLLYDFELEGVGSDVGKLAENSSRRYDWIWKFDIDESIRGGIEMLKT